MAITPIWGQPFPVAEATRGSWVPLDMSTESAYPSSGRGKYAQIVYDIGGTGLSASNPTYVNVVNPVTLTGVISADIIEVENIWFTTPVSAHVLLPNTSVLESVVLTPTTSASITFSPKVETLEVFNNTGSSTVYLLFGTTTFANLTSKGLPILEESYYSIDRDITSVTVGSNGNADLRIIGHRRV